MGWRDCWSDKWYLGYLRQRGFRIELVINLDLRLNMVQSLHPMHARVWRNMSNKTVEGVHLV